MLEGESTFCNLPYKGELEGLRVALMDCKYVSAELVFCLNNHSSVPLNLHHLGEKTLIV